MSDKKKPKQELYEIEKIMGKKVDKNKIHFFVKWKGYANKHNTWEPIENFMDLEYLESKIEEFDHDSKRISSKHRKLKEYRENMSIEEESEEEYDEEGNVKKMVLKKISPKKKRKKSKRRKKSKSQNARNVKFYENNEDDEEEYIPKTQIDKIPKYNHSKNYNNFYKRYKIKNNNKNSNNLVKESKKFQAKHRNKEPFKNNIKNLKRKRKSRKRQKQDSPILSFEELTEFPKRRLNLNTNKWLKKSKRENFVDMSETTVEKSVQKYYQRH